MDEASVYGFPDEPGEDWASMLAELEQRADARTVRLALGVDGDELNRIRMGHAPRPATARRLRTLHELSGRADLGDPGAVAAALLDDAPPARRASAARSLSALGVARRTKLVVGVFVALDVLVGVAIFAFLALRGL